MRKRIEMSDIDKALRRLNIPIAVALAIVAGGAWMLWKGAAEDGTGLFIGGLLIAFFGLIFGIPLSWLLAVERRKSLRMAKTASRGGRTPISMLAANAGVDEQVAREKIVWCMQHGYLDGYVLDGDDVALFELADPDRKKHAATCPNCHASFVYAGDIGQCPYCGDFFERSR